jgi:RNA polymerase sigma-70 factor, ECF subfamily
VTREAIVGIGRSAADRPSLVEVHTAHADFVWRCLQRLGVPAADLEDALQEVFVVVHQRLDTFRGESKLTTWLFGICLRVASRFRRRPHVQRERDDAAALDGAVDARVGPEDDALEREAHTQLRDLLDELDPEKRVVFVMFELERCSGAEVADLLGIPLGTVYSRLHAARTQFAKAAARLKKRASR